MVIGALRLAALGVAGVLAAPAPLAAITAQDEPAAGAPALANGDFEAAASKDDPVPGWTVGIGAYNGGTEPLSVVEVDKKEKHGGKASLHFSASASTLAFRIVEQPLEVRPGGRYKLSAFTKTKGLVQENNARGIPQFNNSYMALFLFDGSGEILGKDVKTLARPSTEGWQQVTAEAVAPAGTRRAEVKLFQSISGEAWFDDLQLTIEGGEPVPQPAPVLADDFEGLTALPPAWLVEEGARNGGTAPPSVVEVSQREGAGKSKRSLHLQGSKSTLLWNSVNRYFEAAPGDAFHFRATVKAKDVRPERNVKGVDQFTNFHMRLVFFDAKGETVGAARYADLGQGTFDWSEHEVRAVAPEGAVRGLAGIFLSMSGEAWLDDIALSRQGGGVPAYAGWQSQAVGHLVLRFPPDHPRAADMAAWGAQVEAALAAAAKALKVEIKDPITMFLYRDGEQGKSLTGRELDYAEPERRAVHQRPNSTLSHELTHVVALDLGYAQTGLLGEGIAVWLNGEPPASHHERAAALLREDKLPAMDALLGDFRAQEQGYPAAGSFCGWLLQAAGVDAFRRIYPKSDPAAASQEVFKKPWAALDTEWRAYLAGLGAAGKTPP